MSTDSSSNKVPSGRVEYFSICLCFNANKGVWHWSVMELMVMSQTGTEKTRAGAMRAAYDALGDAVRSALRVESFKKELDQPG